MRTIKRRNINTLGKKELAEKFEIYDVETGNRVSSIYTLKTKAGVRKAISAMIRSDLNSYTNQSQLSYREL